ncbi:hypothetical protein A0H81_14605 [Grifola frondosa]|uniref:Uncharacterized protein n=1 Tax=Grifola frondosa TaxID=5627 RepID=A0A1C7LKU4_GRIFR|nr:hypothetical protein A0H81_14605 [Grifola frondosa]
MPLFVLARCLFPRTRSERPRRARRAVLRLPRSHGAACRPPLPLACHRSPRTRCGHPRGARHAAIHPGAPSISSYALRTSTVNLPCRYSFWRAVYFLVRAPNVHGEPIVPRFVFLARMAPPAALPYLWHAADLRVRAADIRGESAMLLFVLAHHLFPHTCCRRSRRARHAAIRSGALSISSYVLRTSTASLSCRASSSLLAWRRPPPSPTSGAPPMSACMLRISVVSLPCRYSHWHAADLRVRAADIHGEPAMPLFVFPARMAPPAALPYLWHAADVRVHAADIRGESAMPLFALAGHRSPRTRCGHPRRARHAAIHFGTPSISSYTLRTFTASPPCCYSFWHAADLRVRAADICGEPAVPLFILAHHLFPRTRSERPWRARRAALRLPHSHGAAATLPYLWHDADLRVHTADICGMSAMPLFALAGH